jgi:hypothetical protein
MEWLKMSQFTKSHFEQIAKLLKTTNANNKYEIAQDMAKLFQESNPRFEAKRFFKACGLLIESETPEMKQAKQAYAKLGVCF